MDAILFEQNPLTVNNPVINALSVKQWERGMNAAEKQLEYFHSTEYALKHALRLKKTAGENKPAVLRRIRDIYFYEFGIELTDEEQDKIFCHVMDDFEQYVESFSENDVKYYSLYHIPFGDQEVHIKELLNRGTDTSYLKQILKQEAFYVDGDYAYYDMNNQGIFIRVSPEDMGSILRM